MILNGASSRLLQPNLREAATAFAWRRSSSAHPAQIEKGDRHELGSR
jgi:hypothetical protein